MAKKTQDALFDRLRAQGLRKRVARDLSRAFGKSDGGRRAPAAVDRTVGELRKLVDELEDRARGNSRQKRAATARKAAATRKRQAARRSTAARKGARTRAAKR
jgi:hypothetical protein